MSKQLFYALGPLIFDSLGVIVFAVLLALDVNLIVATIAGTVVAVGVVGWGLARGKPVAALQWISLIMVLFSAGATMLTGDPRFVMAKPSIVYLVVGTAMLRRGWMNRYIPPEELPLVGDVMEKFGFVWAGMMFATAIANLVVAIAFTPWWPAFIGFFPIASKLALFAIHFTIVQIIGRARRRRLAGEIDVAATPTPMVTPS
ncbi:inner membrane-spanning protein YciB [Sphingopyxis fribergensis]